MPRSGLGNTKGAHLAVLEISNHKEDVKLYGQFPDYDDFQRYDLGQEDISHQLDQGIYSNFHKPACHALKALLFPVKVPKKIPRALKSIAGNDKKDDPKQDGMFGRVAKIPIANTFNELSEMDFVDYGDLSTFLHIQDTFRDFQRLFLGAKKKEKQTAGMVRGLRFRIGWLCLGRRELWRWIRNPDSSGKFFRNFAPRVT